MAAGHGVNSKTFCHAHKMLFHNILTQQPSGFVQENAETLITSIPVPDGKRVQNLSLIHILEEYMLLQGAKLGKQLSSVVDVPDDLKGCRLHKLLLQPFVENAIKHGFYKKEVPCILKISMKKIEGQLHIIIKDNGIGMSPAKIAELNRTLEEGKEHLGVANVKKRLKLYYGDEAEVYFESRQDRYTKVHLFIPA